MLLVKTIHSFFFYFMLKTAFKQWQFELNLLNQVTAATEPFCGKELLLCIDTIESWSTSVCIDCSHSNTHKEIVIHEMGKLIKIRQVYMATPGKISNISPNLFSSAVQGPRELNTGTCSLLEEWMFWLTRILMTIAWTKPQSCLFLVMVRSWYDKDHMS